MIKPFGKILKEARLKRGWTTRHLAKLSGIAQPNISLIECYKKPCGKIQSAKLVMALQLKGVELAKFLEAADTSTQSPIFQAIFRQIDASGILLKDIVFAKNISNGLVVQSRDGHSHFVKIEVHSTGVHLT